jgi:23S rRNA (cytosine1962-C5)-methyltransferase
VIAPTGLLLRGDSPVRKLEGLDSYQDSIGEVPDSVVVEEQGLRFTVSLHQGQKTGWFYDQRGNRERLRHYVRGRRVLDVFSYVGAWGLQAAAGGASEVLCVDASPAALERIDANAAANGLSEPVATLGGDAFEVLSGLRAERQRFDVVILDPPAFIKRKKDIRAGEQAYHRLNQLGMQVLSRDGILVTSSCSYHLGESALQRILLQSARHLDRSLQILERGHQAPDHPVHPAIAETAYLKTLFCRILPA